MTREKKMTQLLTRFTERKHTWKRIYTLTLHIPKRPVLISTLVTRALRIFDHEHLDKEMEHSSQVFKDNGYDGKQFNKVAINAKRSCNKKKKNDDSSGLKISCNERH